MDPSSTAIEHFLHVEIDSPGAIQAFAFSANGKYLVVSSYYGQIQVFQVKDGRQIAKMEGRNVHSLAVSNDGRWIAAGSPWRGALVWDANTYKEVFTLLGNDVVDFSPDSTRLVTATNDRVSIWDFAAQKEVVGPLRHYYNVLGAKFSPQGDRIATVTQHSARVYDSNDGSLLIDIRVRATPSHNRGLLWSHNHLFIVSDGKIKQFDPSTGSSVSEWPVPGTNSSSCIILSQHGEFIACSSNRTVTFWDTSEHVQIDAIQHAQHISSIAFSPDGRFLAIGGESGKIAIHSISKFTDLIALPRLHTFRNPVILIHETALYSWNDDQLADADALLTATISLPENTHHALASRALVRTRLQQWDAAIDDANQSIEIEPSAIGYIAKSAALVGKGDTVEGYRACDIAFHHHHSTDIDFLLLIKAVIVFMAGEYDDGISRLDDLIVTVPLNSICYAVQAYMYILLGNSRMECGDYTGAIASFERARSRAHPHESRSLLVISLISGWKFDHLEITIQQHFCEALYAAGRTEEGRESLIEMLDTFEKEICMSKRITKWICDFTYQCLSVDTELTGQNLLSLSPTRLLKEWVQSTLASSAWRDVLVAAIAFSAPRSTIYRAICERLEMTDHVMDAIECLREMIKELGVGTDAPDEQMQWILDFKERCVEKLTRFGDVAADAEQYDNAITQYSTALSLNPIVPCDIFIKRSKIHMAEKSWAEALEDINQVVMLDPLSSFGFHGVLMEWANVELIDGSWRSVLSTTSGFKAPRFAIYRALCERLEIVDRIMDVAECFCEMVCELAEELKGDQEKWILDFKSRCCGKLEGLGDTTMDVHQYAEAISVYSTALSMNPTGSILFTKRSLARAAMDMWEGALSDANEVIKLDPFSFLGYERKHTALCGAGRYVDAIDTLETMHSKLSQSSDPEIRDRSRRYIRPEETRVAIRAAIENFIREFPAVLINTDSGRLLDKSGQASSFTSQPIFAELVSSMITDIDHARIEKEVTEYYRYATFSHRWEDNEPLFEKVIRIVVYDLEESLTHDKLLTFCKIVRDAGFHWAWSDTCCINKADHHVLQEALVLMFKWYEGSALTVVLLRGVHSPSQRGDLVRSIWNSRAWTLQEYHASKVVRFYNEDWTPYLNVDIPNHKESPQIISEMEEAIGISTRALTALHPGLNDIRDKLRLASTRETTRVEDAAYSLFGIFSISLPIAYGEGDKALGKLLAQLLMSSGDASILAWSGRSGSFNSCLPTNITVFTQLQTTHIPPAIRGTELDTVTARLLASSLNRTLVVKLYDQLKELPTPFFVGQRMKLPCIAFKLGPVSTREGSEGVFRAQTTALGIVEITTEEDLSRLGSLYLIHPWLDLLLDRHPVGGITETIAEENTESNSSWTGESSPLTDTSNIVSAAPQTRAARFISRLGWSFGGRPGSTIGDVGSLRPPSSVTQTEGQLEAIRLIARLRQPFGALLLAPTGQNVAEYRRVATESLITVQVEEITSTTLNKLVNSVRVLDVL